MGDLERHLSDEELAELAALADGSLAAERRVEVEARVAASPELSALVERQRRALGAVRPMAEEPVPAGLRERVESLRPGSSRAARPRGVVPRLALGASAAAAAAAVVVVLALSGGGAAPTVADAAQLATKPATGPPPRRAAGTPNALAASVDGVAFPDLRRAYGWRPAGVRRGSLDGHRALVVFYAKPGRRLAYMVVSGDSLGGSSGYPGSRRGGTEYRSFTVGGRPAVTWLRNGHTCVLTGDASPAELLALASRPAGAY